MFPIYITWQTIWILICVCTTYKNSKMGFIQWLWHSKYLHHPIYLALATHLGLGRFTQLGPTPDRPRLNPFSYVSKLIQIHFFHEIHHNDSLRYLDSQISMDHLNHIGPKYSQIQGKFILISTQKYLSLSLIISRN